MNASKEFLAMAQTIFWDFDGVIKDSVTVKSDAFENLFLPYGADVARRIRAHHEEHGGVSRFKKIPLYLSWVNEKTDEDTIQIFCKRFESAVKQAVINSPWVPGVREFLDRYYSEKNFFLITATPHDEILEILEKLGINHFFKRVYGSPKTKSEAIRESITELNLDKGSAVMVGDAETDYLAAVDNNINFILKTAPYNRKLQEKISGLTFETLK